VAFVVDALNLRLDLVVLGAMELNDRDLIFYYGEFVLIHMYQA
jgi:hypothetical protein